MTVLPLTLAAVCGLLVLIWTSRHVQITRQSRAQTLLTPQSPPVANPAPSLSLIVAAKDEEANIEACVRSILAQDYPALEVIVVDDRSRDRTAAIADSLAAADPRVRVVHVESLPEGWCGKNHAIVQGWRAAKGQWLMTTDADCRFVSPAALSVAMREALDTRADLLSVLPAFETRAFYEAVIQPVCGAVMMIWFSPAKVNDPADEAAYANGAFMLMRREAYEAVGTHEALKGVVMEDLALARRFKQGGKALRVVPGRDLFAVRMYDSLAATLRGWTRIFLGSFRTFRKLLLVAALLLGVSLLPFVVAPLGLALAAAGAGGRWALCGWLALAAMAMELSVIFRFYRLAGARKWLFWTYPLGCLAATAVAVMAMAKLLPGAKVTWRGTSYSAAGTGRTA